MLTNIHSTQYILPSSNDILRNSTSYHKQTFNKINSTCIVTFSLILVIRRYIKYAYQVQQKQFTKVCNYSHKFVPWFRLFNLKIHFYMRIHTSKCYVYRRTYLIILWPKFVSNSVPFFLCTQSWIHIYPLDRINMKLLHSLPHNIHIIKDFFIIFPLIFSKRCARQDISLINYFFISIFRLFLAHYRPTLGLGLFN